MNKRSAIVLLCCMTLCSAAASSAFGQESETAPKEETVPKDRRVSLKDKRITITMEAQPLGEVFRDLMKNYDIAVGVEESTLDRDDPDFECEPNMPTSAEHKMRRGDVQYTTRGHRVFQAGEHAITLYIEDGSGEQGFGQIGEQMENYKWEISHDVVNITPVKGRDKRFEKLLELRVKRFTLAGGKTVYDITNNIMALPEFMSFMRDNKLHFNGVRTGMNFTLEAQYGRKIDAGMDFSDLTFRDLLNRATKIKRGGWRIKWLWITGTGDEYIDIDI